MSYTASYHSVYSTSPVDEGVYSDIYDDQYVPTVSSSVGLWRVEMELGGTWIDVSGDTVSVAIRRGTTNTEGVTAVYEAGSFTITLENRERQYEPGFNPDVKPGTRCHISAHNGSLWQRVFTGAVSAWHAGYSGGAFHSEVVASGTDAVETLRRMRFQAIPEVDENETPVAAEGVGDTASQRIHRALDKAGWPVADRDISDGGDVLQGTRWGRSVWDEINEAARAASGALWIDPLGRVTFRTLLANLDMPSEATFADDETGYIYGDPQLSFDWQNLVNQVRYKRAGDAAEPATEIDEQSVAEWTHGYPSTLEDDRLIHLHVEDARAWAHIQLLALSRPEHTIDTILVEPLFDASLPSTLLNLDIASRVTVVFHPPGGGNALQRECWVRGISQSRSDDVWNVELSLASATRFQFFKYDDPELSKLDEVALGPVPGTWVGGRAVATANKTVSYQDLNTLQTQMVQRFRSTAALYAAYPVTPHKGLLVWVTGVGLLYSNGQTWRYPTGS